jgi:anti-sigma-K factor RskA
MSADDRISGLDGPPECDQLEQAAPYVLRALERDEAEHYRAHIAGCSVCSTEVASLQPIVDSLPASTPRVFAPRVLSERVMTSVRSEAELLHAAGARADRPEQTRSRWRMRRPQLLSAAVALGVGLLVGPIVLAGGSKPPVTRVTSAQLVSSPRGASAVLRQVGGRAELVMAGVTQPPSGKIYEIWTAQAGAPPQPTNALFGVTHSGSASVDVPGDLAHVHQVLVTAEPVGGSAHPTSPPFIVATLQPS